MAEKNHLRAIRTPVQLRVIHRNKEICFIYKSIEEGLYPRIRERIEKAGLRMPTASETASLVYSAFQNPKESYSRKIIELIKNKRFLTDTGFLVTEKGYYVKDNPKIKDIDVIMNENELEKELVCSDGKLRFNENRTIRFVPIDSFWKNLDLKLLFDEEDFKIKSIGEDFENGIYLRGGQSIKPGYLSWGSFLGEKWLDVCAGDSLGSLYRIGFTIGIQENKSNK